MGLLSFLGFGNSTPQPQPQPQQPQFSGTGLLGTMRPLTLRTDMQAYNDYAESTMVKGGQPVTYPEWVKSQQQAQEAANAAKAQAAVPPK